MKRVEKIRLYPTHRQDQALVFMLGVTRQLYNAALQERRDAYRLRRVSISAKTQYKEVTALRGPDALDRRLGAYGKSLLDLDFIGAALSSTEKRYRQARQAAKGARARISYLVV